MTGGCVFCPPGVVVLVVVESVENKQFYDDVKLTSRMKKDNYIIVLLNTFINKKEKFFINTNDWFKKKLHNLKFMKFKKEKNI